ncbi:MAG: hypothetical protein RSE47_07070 [Acidaminococcaceae bacterium]
MASNQANQRLRPVGGRGFILLPLLVLIAIFSLLAQGLLHLVQHECEIEQARLREQQIMTLVQSMLARPALTGEQLPVGKTVLPQLVLYPGQETVNPYVEVTGSTEASLHRITAGVVTTKGTNYWQKLCVYPPGGGDNPVYQKTIYAGQRLEGELPPNCSSGEGWGIAELDVEAYQTFREGYLPVAANLKYEGLARKLYVNTGNTTIDESRSYEVPARTLIKGEGVLVYGRPIYLLEGVVAPGEVHLYCHSNIFLGDNVVLQKAFLFSDRDIIIGNNVTINGIIIAKGKIVFGSNCTVNRDAEVLKPFVTGVNCT